MVNPVIIKRAIDNYKSKYDYAIIYVETERNIIGQIRTGKIRAVYTKNKENYLIKVYKGRKQALLTSSFFSDELMDRAISLLESNQEIPYFYGLPSKSSYPEVINLSKNEINLSDITSELESVINLFNDMRKTNETIVLNDSVYLFGKINTQLFTSTGITEEHSSTYSRADIEISKGKFSIADSSLSIKPISLKELTKAVFEKALFYDNKKENLDNVSCNYIIFTPEVMSELLYYALMPNLNSENIEKNNSKFTFNDLNKFSFKKPITIIDNGISNESPYSQPFDFEGSRRQITSLVKDGRLINFIFDYNTAKHHNLKSTGNAHALKPDFTTLYLSYPKNDINSAIVVESVAGAHSADHTSGTFSILINNAYYKNGNDKKPLEPFMINANIFDLFDNIYSMDTNTKQYDQYVLGSCAFPKEKLSLTKL